MKRSLVLFLLTASLPVHAVQPCAAPTRRIEPLHSVAIPVDRVPKDVGLGARGGWRAHTYGERNVPEGWALSTLVSARMFHLLKQDFYLIRVKDEQSLFSTACPLSRCSPDVWLRTGDTILVDRSRLPRGAPEDAFYVHRAGDPTSMVTLLAPDPLSEEYRLVEQCTLTLQVNTP